MLRRSIGRGSWVGLPIALGAMVLTLISHRTGIHALAGIGVSPLLFGLAVYLWGWHAGRTLAFPIEWALKYFTAIPEISFRQLGNALFNVGGIGLDNIADFPAGHALRATVFYGLLAFCVARLSNDRRRGITAYAVAVGLIGAISLIRLYLGAHYPMDLLGGWMAGGALLSVIVAVYMLAVDKRVSA